MMTKLVLVAAGGAIGAALRFLVNAWALHQIPGLPLGTLIVNVVGSFVMGLVAVLLLERPGVWSSVAPFVMTGILGGFTTFSAFSLDTLYLFERGRIGLGAAYVAGSVLLSVGALALGLLLARRLLA